MKEQSMEVVDVAERTRGRRRSGYKWVQNAIRQEVHGRNRDKLIGENGFDTSWPLFVAIDLIEGAISERAKIGPAPRRSETEAKSGLS